PPSIWAEVLADATSITQWPERALPSIAGVRLVPCQHAEEEARTLALILCEGVAQNKQTALITPDEGLMARVTAHLAR
ncbi:hypothetical protein, partial [Enterococcus casseliflavus]|uniref:hypothetical protein n=1 Tax=Enterococcus casseliflavus TaxID=37734 RepID=UPI003D0B1066